MRPEDGGRSGGRGSGLQSGVGGKKEDRAERAKKAERAARAASGLCAFLLLLAVALMAFYLVKEGVPAVFRAGLAELLFTARWDPCGETPRYGILSMALTTLAGTGLAALLGIPVGILTAVFLAETAGKRAAGAVRQGVELMAGIPSVLYGLVGIRLLNPAVYRLELFLFRHSPGHRFTGGANLLSASLVLAVMILPTVIEFSEVSIRGVDPGIREASLALGGSRIQTVFRAVLPEAGSGILTACVLGLGRALGETMAITLVSGGSVNAPLPFRSVRFLTTAVAGEMGYASGVHRQALFFIGLALFLFLFFLHGAVIGRLRKRCGEGP